MNIHLPQTKQLRDLLSDLLGREVTLTPSPPFAPGPDTPASVAVYVDDSLQIRAVIACDLAFSAHAGAAIALIPVGAAEDAIADGKLTDALSENLYEVLNIAASMFNVEGADHLKLYQLHAAGPPLDPMVRIQTLTLGRREDVRVDLAGYGSGSLSVVLI
ncbi:hypothetical protein F0U44_15560 [Nocardioides humilatus]|uniref:Chemotaxis phosphatase CheX-like domain-containing protein n=1 Tax=Nocardioides humilatus TaxID=2607660 RepID=A0A5B1LD41_9ACTN|nr:hypothetical protein [Nocardioides humilatus]KAA1417710.1 hypothetical protein F0U44_15560 [Nocardioides humilatus]